MATFVQIYTNLIVGAIVCWLSLTAFGFAYRWEYNNQLAPRSWSRPKQILKNVLKPPYFWSWIPWAIKMEYPDLMEGVPGTGTRANGWSGPKLNCNLDGIIMLKFHTLMLKVSVLATVLCTCILLPVYYTAKCDPDILGWGTCAPLLNLTDFEQCTITNIPIIDYNAYNTTNGGTFAPSDGLDADPIPGDTLWLAQVSGRYLATVLVSYAIYYYTCVLVWREWIDNLSLRRVYYLEHDHYKERLDELDGLMAEKDPEDPFQKQRPPWLPHPELRETVPNVSLFSVLYQLPSEFTVSHTENLPEDASDLDRQLAATVEFFDQCVPNQPGYSSSVAAASILPEANHVALAWRKWYKCGKTLRKLRFIKGHVQQRFEQQEQAETIIEASDIEKVIPPPPSVIPDNKEPAQQQGAPTTASAAKSSEPERVDGQKDDMTPSLDGNVTKKKVEETSEKENSEEDVEDVPELASSPEKDSTPSEVTGPEEDDQLEVSIETTIISDSVAFQQETPEMEDVELGELATAAEEEEIINCISNSSGESLAPPRNEKFEYADFDIMEYAKTIGLEEETELEDLLTDIGIEQLAVYAREYAQSSSNAFPFGCGEDLIRFSSLEKLQQMEAEALLAVQDANKELTEARASVNELSRGVVESNGDEDDGGDVVNVQDGGGGMDKENHDNEDADVDLAALEEAVQPQNREVSGIRQRAINSIHKWDLAQSMAKEIQRAPVKKTKKKKKLSRRLTSIVTNTADVIKHSAARPGLAVANVLEHPTYAVVTFTSRQSAVAARQCLADGGGLDRWVEIDELPVYPLADAPPRDIMFCRGCCRPVTLTISENEKRYRRFTALTLYICFCFFYTIPLAATSQLLDPANLAELFPDIEAFQDPDNIFFRILAGISSGLLYTLFFSFCPQLFKAIANYEGNVSSKQTAEDKALKYYWYFMLVTAFTGTALAQMLVQGLVQGLSLGAEFKEVLVQVAAAIPTKQAPVWMNWIIVRFTYTLPFLYLFQANTFGFSIIRWPWMGRLMRGGGPGGPPPYRIYIDSGTVFMCITTLAPVCPVVAPAATAYYIVICIMLRWLLIFVYRPWYDGGGNKWPALHEIIISSLILGQVLLVTMLALKQAFIPSILAAVAILPTYFFSEATKQKFGRAYHDAGLLQSSRLDGWDPSEPTSKKKREEYRMWLVDCHKASYVPICLAGSGSLLTVEPAAVVATERDQDRLGDGRPRLVRIQRGAVFRRGIGATSSKEE